MSDYATKADLKNISHVDTSNLKTEVDKLDIDKLRPFPVDLNKVSDVVKNDVVSPIQDGLFWGCSQMGEAFWPPSLKSATHILQ